MDYKELIEDLRYAADINGTCEIELEYAADAIEALLSERDAAEKNQDIYRAALDRWGAQMQTVVAIEEMSELQKELCKSIRGDGLTAHIAEEIADVSIMLEQMTMLYHVRGAVEAWRRKKLERLEKRIKGEDDA